MASLAKRKAFQEEDIVVRDITSEDYPSLVNLWNNIGYPVSLSEVQQRMSDIEKDGHFKTCVLICKEIMIGFIGMQKSLGYEEDGLHVRIRTMIVHDDYRNHGFGKRLLKTCEEWAKRMGVKKIHLSCNMGPGYADSHAFYVKQGYIPKSMGLSKRL